LERGSRALAHPCPISITEAHASSSGEALADASAFAEALIFATGGAGLLSETIAEAIAETAAGPKKFCDAQTFSIGET